MLYFYSYENKGSIISNGEAKYIWLNESVSGLKRTWAGCSAKESFAILMNAQKAMHAVVRAYIINCVMEKWWNNALSWRK